MTREGDGRIYEQASAHQKEWGRALIADLNLQGAERVLDLGCGDGTLTARMAALVPQGEVAGLDSSRGMIAAAQPKARPNLRFILMDINAPDLREEFDVIFSNAALHWVKDHRPLYENVRRLLRPGGRIRFNFGGAGNCVHLIQVIREAMSQPAFSSYFAEFDWPWYMPAVEEYMTLVKASGLHDVRVWNENADRYFADAEAIVRWIDQPSIVPFLSCVAERQKKEFRDYVMRGVLEATRQSDSRCFEAFRRINVSARK
jgi:trans-aconitate methyltransferase